MRPRTLLIVAAVVALVLLVVLAGGLPEAAFGTGSGAPALVRGIGGMLGPRVLLAEDLGSGTACAASLAPALAGQQTLTLPASAACILDVPVIQGLLVRPRALRLRVESGALQMAVVQRGRGNSLTMEDSFGPGRGAEASFGERGGTVRLACPTGCVLSFRP